jgi:hypothetical protein
MAALETSEPIHADPVSAVRWVDGAVVVAIPSPDNQSFQQRFCHDLSTGKTGQVFCDVYLPAGTT